MDERAFKTLESYLLRIPAIDEPISYGDDQGLWWVKFTINIKHRFAWNVVQELGCVLNYLSLNERLPTVFKPVSPAPYMNGGPDDFLSWVIECEDKEFKPATCQKWLEGRLPNPVDDATQWHIDEGDYD